MFAGSGSPTRLPDGKGDVTISGQLKEWHKVTLTLDGPFAAETDESPNPFTDLAINVTFMHEVSGNRITNSRMAAVLVSPEFWWMEAGCSSDLVIKGNEYPETPPAWQSAGPNEVTPNAIELVQCENVTSSK